MDAKTCIEKLYRINSVAAATVDAGGNPQVRTIGVMHIEEAAVYFLTARGKPFYHELITGKRVQLLGLSKFKETIRLDGIPELLPREEQRRWLDLLFEENPYMNNVYPGESRYILDVFRIRRGGIEYFNLGVRPIFRESYPLDGGTSPQKGYEITEACIGCGSCLKSCPQGCIAPGAPYRIHREHCLHCGACAECCPVSAVQAFGRSCAV